MDCNFPEGFERWDERFELLVLEGGNQGPNKLQKNEFVA